MGSFGWVAGKRILSEQLLQLLFSATKMPLLIGSTVLLSLPSFFVFNLLLGLGDDFANVVRCIFGSLASFALTVVTFAPFTLLFYFVIGHYSASYQWAVLFNALMFAFAAAASQWVMWRGYRPLVLKNGNHMWGLLTWVATFAFVGIQMGWTLRPFIGSPVKHISFFRDEPFSNAYLAVIRVIQAAISGG